MVEGLLVPRERLGKGQPKCQLSYIHMGCRVYLKSCLIWVSCLSSPCCRLHGVVSCLPTHAWDAAMGAAAGAAAVIISMPLVGAC